MTEITQVNEPHSFTDEERFGPYAFWHHQHFFREVENEVEIEDLIHYGLPFGFAGRLFAGALVRGQLKRIFNYRKISLEKIFGKAGDGASE